VEQAIILSRDASFWLNTGWCDTMEALHGQNQAFKSIDIPYKYNNTARANDRGGNDFWESGAARPDVILHDLVKIFHPEIVAHDGRELYYYKKVD
jgi:iron complex transport system substrate-binding protein